MKNIISNISSKYIVYRHKSLKIIVLFLQEGSSQTLSQFQEKAYLFLST